MTLFNIQTVVNHLEEERAKQAILESKRNNRTLLPYQETEIAMNLRSQLEVVRSIEALLTKLKEDN